MQKYLLLLLLPLLGLAGCRTTELRPVSTSVNASSASVVESAIMAGCAARGWTARKVGDHEIEASISRRQHFAAVRIVYSASGYEILYKDSANLKYNGRTIHSVYRNWTTYLDNSIRRFL